MDTSQLSQMLLEQDDASARRQFFMQNAHRLDDDLAQALKAQADHYLRTEMQRSMAIAETLLQMAEYSGNPKHRALGLLARANVFSLGLGDYERSLEDYEEAAAIYRQADDQVDAARSQVGKIWALSNLSRYAEAQAAAAWASDVLEAANALQPLATLTMNRAISLGRQGDDIAALAMFDRARELFAAMGEDGRSYLPWIDQNRSIVLRNLGRLQDSLDAAERAWRGMEAEGEVVEAARARQSMAITYLLLGRYTEALNLMEDARRIFLGDGRQRDALLLDLFLCDALLPLRRFREVLAITRNVRPFFAQRGMDKEIGQALLDEAVAYTGLGRFDEARASLIEARQRFTAAANPALIAAADLELAAMLLHLDDPEQSAALLENAEQVFSQRDLAPQLAQTWLLQARVDLSRGRWDRAERLAQRALDVARKEQIITLAFRARHILGQALERRNEPWQAMEQYERAIRHLERLHGYLMTEFQADFLEDKTEIYEDAVLLALNIGAEQKALELAERAKSRSLLNMIANRIDLSLHARRPQDEAIVTELIRLRKERDRILLRWETGEDVRAGKDARAAQNRIWELERQITKRWHQLLIHNADYARDEALWQVRAESPQPWLDEETLLVEYFMARGQPLAFLIDKHQVQVVRLQIESAQVTRLLTLLSLNNRTLPWAPAKRQQQLARNARNLLTQLHRLLIQPLQPRLDRYARLIITPHGNLHYLPFHALFDGQRHLIETHEISYLPASSLLRFSVQPRNNDGRTIAFGYSSHGLLPNAVAEAHSVAAIMAGRAAVEEDAIIARLKEAGPTARVLHFATHGEFRGDNPLFSGILLADGWLTALDIFNLRFEASLITLSACDTGQHRIAGGDELLGLTRAFLYAGAASLLLSHWQIPDAIASEFITDFYRHLAAGERKATALRRAQLALLHRGRQGEPNSAHYQHPFIWAPFFLMGSPHNL
jgi:CHAT domain-containing protein